MGFFLFFIDASVSAYHFISTLAYLQAGAIILQYQVALLVFIVNKKCSVCFLKKKRVALGLREREDRL